MRRCVVTSRRIRRLSVALAAALALHALAGVLVLAACTPPPVASPSPTPGTPTPLPTGVIAPTPTPTRTPPAPSPTPTPTPAPTSLTSPRGSITVDQPRGFARVSSPLAISGSAIVFEGALQWRIVDLAGKEIAKGNAQTSAGAPARGTFSVSATFSVPADTLAYVEVFSRSPRDGSIEDMARVPVALAAR